MRDGTPRVLMPPGATAGDSPGAGGRPLGALLRRAGVVVVAVPVQTPLVADAGQREEAAGVHRRVRDARRPVERGRRGPCIAPGEARALEAAAGCLFPLGLGREPMARSGLRRPP